MFYPERRLGGKKSIRAANLIVRDEMWKPRNQF
jgi:hypothetical protein